MPRKLAAGNWKMNGTQADLAELAAMAEASDAEGPEVLICPPATLITAAAQAAPAMAIGGQDCHAEPKGAFTGDLSAAQLIDAGATYVILGHSERRDAYEEGSDDVRAKARAAQSAGLTAVICLGESETEREANNTLDIISGQLAGSVPDAATPENTVIAYEPVWAIGTGKVPSLEQIAEVHDFMREKLSQRFGEEAAKNMRLLYGGSVKASNAEGIFAIENVDGALVGGASLKAADFTPIIKALAAS
ncbi:triose-phosphate isomerase [Alphaproteobacteria bacterium KMM 3653]|uniref:Triosephosphate isomerase n=1 Tax=Harenicola maris TaxID=2841044 RepID=A0AAP2CRJ8_9RHOB|nr:triose-phosphate isomerase [Harenicola maris]